MILKLSGYYMLPKLHILFSTVTQNNNFVKVCYHCLRNHPEARITIGLVRCFFQNVSSSVFLHADLSHNDFARHQNYNTSYLIPVDCGSKSTESVKEGT